MVWFKWIVIAICVFLGLAKIALSDPLDTWTTWSTAQPYVSKQVPPGALIMRGQGTDAYYVAEIDASTGAIPVTLSGGSFTVDYSGPTGDPVPADAAFVGGVDGSGDLRGLKVDTNGELQVDVLSSALPSGAATEATLSALNAKFGSLGQKAMTGSAPVVIASDQSTLPVSAASLPLPSGAATEATLADIDNKVATESTLGTLNGKFTDGPQANATSIGVTEGGRAYSDSAMQDYSSGNVTTGAWVQIDASTAAAINVICVNDTSGQIMELGTGSAASETRVFLIAQGFSGCIPLRIASGTRLSLRAVTATANTGYFTYSGMN